MLDIVEESCKNKLFYSAHSYSKNPSVPLIGLFDNYQINVNNNINNNLDQSNNNIINNFNNLINLDESYLGRINNKNSKNTKNYAEENNNKNNKDYNLNQSDFLNFKLLDSSKNTNLNLYFK